ncbi:MAG: hypothetical protein FJX47_15630, partial [Alphaproteobacteria bacterium]|nr:hypothetical protein [Alphaproteobacteria bacterium]
MTRRVAVIGSGPAGYATARALIERGIRPVVFDAGETLDPDRAALIATLRALPKSDWPSEAVARISANPTVNDPVPLKLAFGSDYIYGRNRAHSPYDSAGVGLWPTFARGGYSTVWGAAVQPYHQDDLADWPFASNALRPHIDALLAELPLVKGDDGLAAAFPVTGRATKDLPAPIQAEMLLRKLGGATTDPAALFGRARLMVEGGTCNGCRLCLTGCPLGAIWDSGEAIQRLARKGALDYRPGLVLRQVDESGTEIHLAFVDRDGGPGEKITADRVFLAAGALGSTRVLLQSIHRLDHGVTLKTSQKALVPILTSWRGNGAMAEAAPALAGAFLELKVPENGPHWMHVQLSPVNDLLLQRLGIGPGGIGHWRRRLLAPMLERLMVCWTGLHSDLSSGVALALGANGTVQARPAANARSAEAFSHALRRLSGVLRRAGALALLPTAKI